ncbi:hypothetical protein Fot_37395 [Forsythia ovata]|uniref:Uncharacterized protein n=1 Tax=Forsythia ovata TaxID=205694 RepID=A0ABD1RYV4_9LAMI
MENEEVDRGQNSLSFKEKDLFNKRQREQLALSKDYRNKRRRKLLLKKSNNKHTNNYTQYRQQLNSERSEWITCNHNEVDGYQMIPSEPLPKCLKMAKLLQNAYSLRSSLFPQFQSLIGGCVFLGVVLVFTMLEVI